MRWKRLFVFVVVFPLVTWARSYNDVYVLTVPKSGTHLVKKYLQLVRAVGKRPRYRCEQNPLREDMLRLPNNFFSNPKVKKILVIRDLRDVVCSALDYVNWHQCWIDRRVYFAPGWSSLSQQEQLCELINIYEKPAHLLWSYWGRRLPHDIKYGVDRAVALYGAPNVVVIRFEELSGNHGVEAQLGAIRRINGVIGVALSGEEEQFIVTNLFGNRLIKSPTF